MELSAILVLVASAFAFVAVVALVVGLFWYLFTSRHKLKNEDFGHQGQRSATAELHTTAANRAADLARIRAKLQHNSQTAQDAAQELHEALKRHNNNLDANLLIMLQTLAVELDNITEQNKALETAVLQTSNLLAAADATAQQRPGAQ